jgi:hypothetical protein
MPQELLDKARASHQAIVVAVAKELPADDIRNGLYSHLGIRLENEELRYQPRVAPAPKSGRWSKTNAEGAVKRLKDRPMVWRAYSYETPNFGDWSRGSHTMSGQRREYQREYTPPKHLAVAVTLLSKTPGPSPAYLVKFALDEVLDPQAPTLENDLLYDLNILQENVGAADIYPADADLDQYRASLAVQWEVLPPRHRLRNLSRITKDAPDLAPDRLEVIQERYELLESLGPENVVMGTSGFSRYFGALLPDDMVVFENIRYGNAVYIMSGDWQGHSQLTRTELLAKAQRDFMRIPHRKGWQERVRFELAAMRQRNETGKVASGKNPVAPQKP